MTNYYLLAIPAIIGIVVGLLLITLETESNNENTTLLTAQKLVKNGSPMIGDPNAPVTILEWGDYQCTFCYRFHDTSLKIIQEEYVETGIANLVFKDFPLKRS